MSFEVYFQGFEKGDARPGGGRAARSVLGPSLRDLGGGANRLVCATGTADVYGLDDDAMMANHIQGIDAWAVLVDAARAASWAIMPVGSPTCVFSESQLQQLPEELRGDARVITDSEDLIAVIESS